MQGGQSNMAVPPALTLVHFKQYRGHWGNVWVKYLHHLKEYNVAYMMWVKYTIEIVCGGFS
jgi:hypothetical protein